MKFMGKDGPIRFEGFSFGSIRTNGATYEHDVVIDRGRIMADTCRTVYKIVLGGVYLRLPERRCVTRWVAEDGPYSQGRQQS